MTHQAVQDAVKNSTSGKFLIFRLAGETFGLEILKVREIIGMMDVTAVPLTPSFIRGIINLRGRVIPLMDLRAKFEMPPADTTAPSCIIVVLLEQMEIGIVVDGVSDVRNIAAQDVEETPSFGAAVDTRFISGIAKTGGKVTILLDVDKVLTEDQIRSVKATV